MKSFFLTIFGLSNFIIQAVIINIPANYLTIQEGINAGATGDTILVQPGIYHENINFNGHNVTVASLFLTSGDSTYIQTTIIDGSNQGNVVKFQNYESPLAQLIGFTITHGLAELFWSYYYGGGIIITHADPEILNCIITENNAYIAGKGGGVFCAFSCATFRNVVIDNNFASHTGGGIQINNTSHLMLDNVAISNNTALWGGGLYIYGNSNPIFSRVKIISNYASYEGGGIICHNNCDPQLVNLTIYGNYAPEGGALYVGSNCNVSVLNSIIWNNQNPIDLNGGIVSITYSDVQGNWNGIGNFDSDPLFEDPQNNNFHLTGSSPCIDAGDPSSPPDPDGTIADVGRYYLLQGLNADFTADPTSGHILLEVNFTDNSSGNIIFWEWDFNYDGVIDSYDESPVYTYSIPGIYTVSLTIDDGENQDTEIKEDFIHVHNIEALFEANVTSGYAPLEVQFTDLSNGDITSWEWDFNNDGIIDSYQQNPNYCYEEIDTFSVKLTIHFNSYSDEFIQNDYITTFEHVACEFSGNPTTGSAPLYVHFYDQSAGNIIQRLWDFENDGIIDSNDNNPICCYDTPGLYSVYLWVSDGTENDYELKEDYINVEGVGAANNIINKTSLIRIYPNPFNPIANILFEVKENETASLEILNAKGQKLISNNYHSGNHLFIWDAGNYSSGVYFIRLKSESYIKVDKTVLLK